jgi:tetratricopeptide (TPR) repeat protein
MKKMILILTMFLSLNAFGNINYIQINKIPNFENYKKQFDFLFKNLEYYNHWEATWPYAVDKKDLVKGLMDIYDTFSLLDDVNLEVYLLLGDISHYLYNLQEDDYFNKAIGFYQKAIEISPKDYRTHWFIANHYSLSNVPEKAILHYIKAQDLLPTKEPSEFWDEYAMATAIANMPSHSIYAMDKAKGILGKPGWFESQLGDNIRQRIEPLDENSTYSSSDIWTASVGELISFVSRPLGLRILIDSTWNVSFYDYQNNMSFVTIVPPAIPNKAGRDITYTIAIIMKVAKKGDDLQSFIENFVSKYPDKKSFEFSSKYPNIISYEIKDKSMYPEIGGAHMHILGINRTKPKYAGYLLEEPIELPNNKSDELIFYKVSQSKDRFDGVIFYAIMLDTCEDIYDQAFKVFKSLFYQQINIE